MFQSDQRRLMTALVTMGCLIGTCVKGAEHEEKISHLLTQYCLDCHDSETKKADVDLSTFGAKNTFLQHRQIWSRVEEVLTAGEMPPPRKPQPTMTERDHLIAWVRQSLRSVDWAAVRSPGRVALSRLTRAEYQYSIQDLFGVAVDFGDLLPDDPDGLSGFANDRASLVMTDKLLTGYMKAAEVAAAAILDASVKSPIVIRYEVEEGENAHWTKRPTENKDGSVGWSFSSRLGTKYQAVRKSLDFPRTGKYRVRMRARSKGPGPNASAWIAIDAVNSASREAGMLVTGETFQVVETELFVTKGRHTVLLGYDFYGPLWLPKPPLRAQVKLGQSTFDPPPYDRTGLLPEGIKLSHLERNGFSVAADRQMRVAELIDTINDGYFSGLLDKMMRDKFHFEKGYLPVFLGGLGSPYHEKAVPALEELAAMLGTERKALETIWKEHTPASLEELASYSSRQKAAWTSQDQSRKSQVGDLFVDWIELESIAGGHAVPQQQSEVAAYLQDLLPRAFRRPMDMDTQERYMGVYLNERKAGAEHRPALQRLLIAILISPEFVYRSDGPPSVAGVAALDDHALAARLAGFLWASSPDGVLTRIAHLGVLQDDDGLDQQVDRMLDDPRRQRWISLFMEQWLDLSGIGLEKEPDKELFRYFSWRLAEDMRSEVVLLFDRIVRENRSVLELLDTDETFLNERLARLYDIEGVHGDAFRSVALNDRRRGGLLGTAAVLTTTSLATRTSPVRRGQFVLETLLDVHLPPPPAGVPPLDDAAGQSREVSLRDSLARHRADDRCAGCHAKIDPVGFAMENFDWIGRWRTEDPAGPVDAAGSLPNGQKLNGIVDLKAYLVKERADDFARGLTKSLLAFALGRELEYFDEAEIRKILQALKTDGYRAQTLIKAIVKSYPFRFREIAPQDMTADVAQSQFIERSRP